MSRTLIWFRSDLRCHDNTALQQALQQSDHVLAIFLLTPSTWQAHDWSARKVTFLLANLAELSQALWKLGVPLLIRSASSFERCPELLEQACHEFEIDELHFNREYPVDERARDDAVMQRLSSQLNITTFDGGLVLPPGTVLSRQDTPLKVFTPFKKTWLKKATESLAWTPEKTPRRKLKPLAKPDAIPDQVKGFKPTPVEGWPAGERAALQRLKTFCADHLLAYDTQRDIPSQPGTSRLSAYLSLGVISPRQCITQAHTTAEQQSRDPFSHSGIATWISELIWREFYQHIVFHFPRVCRYQPFKPETDNIPWRHDPDLFTAWQRGMTGFPIVDAAMRELNQTGWMHNRCRMITAMFLSKILRLDWRLGEKYFMQQLIDGDFAANNGGWQWSASTGTDAVPYFRIFNPTTQSERFDPDGEYIKTYCKELANLNAKRIHAPFAKGDANVKYPKPIVDYKAMREETIALFKECK